MTLADFGAPGYDDCFDDCLCGGDAECDQPDCVADRAPADLEVTS